uniref:Uncharacterized protein n=1 Tax=Ralstonia solanacearum TaxID=305 RepID=A0A0S4VUN1_RALSL|nr:protein of unknown function [Ralstonia solanacearum]CUV62044.1 protein of unknown function [Ralstonia solanacearum]
MILDVTDGEGLNVQLSVPEVMSILM